MGPGMAAQSASETTTAEGHTTLLVGNPNVGKSVLFKNLTNRYVTVSNYPGTTVEFVRARAAFDGRSGEVIDTPGINDLTPRSADARVTQRMLEQYANATLVQVADSKNLRRALLLTLQLADLQRPTVLVLNMQDELEDRGGSIDTERLAEVLGIPVVRTVATRNQGTQSLIEALAAARPPNVFATPPGDDYAVNRARLARVNEILGETYSISQPRHATLRVRLGFWAMHPLKGLALLALVLTSVFWFVGLFGAGTLVDVLEGLVFEQRVNPLAIRAADAVLPFPHEHDRVVSSHSIGLPVTPTREVTLGVVERTVVMPDYSLLSGTGLSASQQVARFIHDSLVGEFGAITMALSYALAIVLPIVTAFFLVFGMLEDSGYFARMAVMVNRAFRVIGLNGKAVLPMILGLGCDTMATMTTRILETRRERVVTTMLLALAVPCSAQLGVLLAMMAALSPSGALLWLGVVICVIVSVGWLTARVIGGESSLFIMEIPPMRRPQFANVATKTLARLDWYLREVIPVFVAGTAVLFLLDRADVLVRIAQLGEPLVSGWLGLPKEMANAFLVGFMRRDFGAVYILDAATGSAAILSEHQIFVAMVTITLFMPCFANFLMIVKEYGARTAWAIAGFVFPFAFVVGGILNHVGTWLLST